MLGNPQVLSLFARQHWVASVRQLRELGVSKSSVMRACEIELIERVSHGVYRLASATLGVEGRSMALLLQTPPGSFISGMTAGWLYGLRRMPTHPIEVTVPVTVRRRVPDWARLVRCRSVIADRDVIVRNDGIVVSSPLRTLFRFAAMFNQFRFERAAEDMWHRGLITPDEAAFYLADIRRSGRSGVARMERWLARTTVSTRPSASGLEHDLLDLVMAAGLPEPVRQYPLKLLSGELIHIDLAWPKVRFGLEPGHTWWHGGDLKMRSDQARDRACTEIGWHVVRYDEVSLKDPGTSAQLGRMYRQQALLVGGPSATELPTPTPPAA